MTTTTLVKHPGHSKPTGARAARLSALASAPSAITTDSVWASYASQLLKIANGGLGDSEVACIAGQTLCVDLANADTRIANATVYSIANTVPAWGPTYAPFSSLVTAYATFLSWINLGGSTDPNIQSQLNIASTALNNAQSNFSTVLANAVTAWNAAKQINPTLAFGDFVQSSYPTYIAANNALTGAMSAYTQLAQQAYGPGYQVIQADMNKVSAVAMAGGALDYTMQNAMNMACAVGSVAPAGSVTQLPGSNLPPAPSTLQTIYQPAYQLGGFTTKYQEWQTASVNKQYTAGGTIEIDSSALSYTWSDSGWSASGSTSFGWDFLSVSASGGASSETVNVDWSSASVSCTVTFTGLATFLFNQAGSPLFDPSVIANYCQNLRAASPPNVTPTFFGPGGSLALMPTKAIVGFEPTVTLSFDSQTYASVKSQFQASASASLNIGPFHIGGTGSTFANKSDLQYSDAECKITIGPQLSTVPMLLGVICTKLGGH